MTDSLRTTYRRADGQPLYSYEDYGDNAEFDSERLDIAYFDKQPALDLIEEQWDGDTLVRWREIRLGAPEPCDNPHCQELEPVKSQFRGEAWGEDSVTGRCLTCNGSGVKPRDIDPQWTEVGPTGETEKS